MWEVPVVLASILLGSMKRSKFRIFGDTLEWNGVWCQEFLVAVKFKCSPELLNAFRMEQDMRDELSKSTHPVLFSPFKAKLSSKIAFFNILVIYNPSLF